MDKADMKQDKKMMAGAVHKHEKRLHPGKPMTKFAQDEDREKAAVRFVPRQMFMS